MNLAKRLLPAVLICAAMLNAVAAAQASTGDSFTADEIAYLSDLAADGMGPAVSAQGLVDEGWTICRALASGMTPTAAAAKVYDGARIAGGITQAQAGRVVADAMNDLCVSATHSGTREA